MFRWLRACSVGTQRAANRWQHMLDLTPLLSLAPYLALIAALCALPAVVIPRSDD